MARNYKAILQYYWWYYKNILFAYLKNKLSLSLAIESDKLVNNFFHLALGFFY